jgi:hypothetical protein
LGPVRIWTRPLLGEVYEFRYDESNEVIKLSLFFYSVTSVTILVKNNGNFITELRELGI